MFKRKKIKLREAAKKVIFLEVGPPRGGGDEGLNTKKKRTTTKLKRGLRGSRANTNLIFSSS